jgi:hypothetical protein
MQRSCTPCFDAFGLTIPCFVSHFACCFLSYRDEHLVAYEMAMDGIRGESPFKSFVQRAQSASESAKRVHGDAAAKQSTHDITELYRHAQAVKRRFQQFVQALAARTKGGLEAKTDKVTGDLVLKNQERVVEKSGLRADRDNVWKVEIVCDVVSAALRLVAALACGVCVGVGV